ncbi:flagellar M-ring protein FliF [Vibrio sp. HA2012]|uniref:flagellar basal-body MS-ring/collar protein FliF n=1 Tax=Vibrio sp. HA2012 TaxID=1971595 RepID=UPI000C2CD588|nr:flagellar basal-body MS-ring/collar protein FliF [Vibrio sp. HA2012]PJC86442.1 flagellar M-ring protein FliF [Vibrio sp. HA2012]
MSEVIPQPVAVSSSYVAGNPYFERARSLWNSSQRNLVLSAVLAAIVAAIIVVALWSSNQNYRPLYGNQERFDTGEIISVLETEDIPYRLQEENGQVLVEEGEVARIRMLLAAKGVKAQLPTGLESLQDESSLGTSQFMETARYRHGLEGELVRTILSLNAVTNVRVHLAIPRETLFVRHNAQAPSASVMVELKAGEDLKTEQVEAIINLVTGSVTGMKVENVSVVDQYGRLLSADIGSEESGRVNAKYLDYQKRLEKQIIQRASDMLTPIVGASNFRVQVAADLDFSRTEETQEVVDNDPVVRNEHRIDNATVDKIALGVPGTLSNEPPVVRGQNTDDSKNTSQRTELNRQYAVGSSVRHTRYQQGKLNKLSVSVLLNSASAPVETGWTEDEKQQIGTMIRDAVGISAERGDNLSILSFNFTQVEMAAPAEIPWWQDPTIQQPIRYLIGGILGLSMIFFVLRPLVLHLTGIERRNDELNFASGDEEDEFDSSLQTRSEREHEKVLNQRLSDKGIELGATSGLDSGGDLLPPPGSPLEIQLKHLQLIASDEPTRVAEVLKQWVNINEQRTQNESV